jgi:hypothetical protein
MGLLELILIIFIILCFTGWGYGSYGPRPGPYAGPSGILGFILVVVLILVLLRHL